MKEAFVNICDVPSHVMTWGQWIEEPFKDKKELIIFITGNPGWPIFYSEFLSTIYKSLGKEIPVWTIDNLGQDIPPQAIIRKIPTLKGNENKFNLKGQVQQKVEFITQFVPEDVKIHLVGHSIGSWIILQLLKEPKIKQRIQKCYLLYPTIERMKSTNNGFQLMMVARLFFLIRLLFKLYPMLPFPLQTLLLRFIVWKLSLPERFTNIFFNYCRLSIFEKIIYLAKDEMEIVRNLDVDLIWNNLNLLKFYYGATDGWVPVEYFEEIKQKIPNVDAELDRRNIDHSFMIHSSIKMGHIVADWIALNRNN